MTISFLSLQHSSMDVSIVQWVFIFLRLFGSGVLFIISYFRFTSLFLPFTAYGTTLFALPIFLPNAWGSEKHYEDEIVGSQRTKHTRVSQISTNHDLK